MREEQTLNKIRTKRAATRRGGDGRARNVDCAGSSQLRVVDQVSQLGDDNLRVGLADHVGLG